jgi:hypothetical protein
LSSQFVGGVAAVEDAAAVAVAVRGDEDDRFELAEPIGRE